MHKIALLLFIIFFIPINALLAQEDVEIIEITEETTPKDIPFAVVEKAPVYPGCFGDDNKKLKECLSYNISAIVSSNFDIKKVSKGLEPGKHYLYVVFKINKEGYVTNVKVRAPKEKSEKDFEKEVIRVMKKIPQMEPGQQKGKDVSVLYSLPISFETK
ncbi:hypothetical protein GCM10011344_38810 [Dokdonia pacifica]|uniref:TonB protein C-terminal n=1 Tax=Dokdonia pacifica TaxID=1627892 RepID=A0A239A1G6_9FLAO|nr:energy transducer TonB [Dokdonia pacifica]GGG34297.1 hypothetical protein GCM10011344_38810 [Dokdonia pacifica]SNR88948.1 TonB protein C-terminal [Dokdonia pacifica]